VIQIILRKKQKRNAFGANIRIVVSVKGKKEAKKFFQL